MIVLSEIEKIKLSAEQVKKIKTTLDSLLTQLDAALPQTNLFLYISSILDNELVFFDNTPRNTAPLLNGLRHLLRHPQTMLVTVLKIPKEQIHAKLTAETKKVMIDHITEYHNGSKQFFRQDLGNTLTLVDDLAQSNIELINENNALQQMLERASTEKSVLLNTIEVLKNQIVKHQRSSNTLKRECQELRQKIVTSINGSEDVNNSHKRIFIQINDASNNNSNNTSTRASTQYPIGQDSAGQRPPKRQNVFDSSGQAPAMPSQSQPTFFNNPQSKAVSNNYDLDSIRKEFKNYLSSWTSRASLPKMRGYPASFIKDLLGVIGHTASNVEKLDANDFMQKVSTISQKISEESFSYVDKQAHGRDLEFIKQFLDIENLRFAMSRIQEMLTDFLASQQNTVTNN
ncbi:MAG: hypothetical protein H0U71_06110 [Gammaproteobacteria bacterium]|nr:hypothetical protein [Gammaproteobacteria bacterium]